MSCYKLDKGLLEPYTSYPYRVIGDWLGKIYLTESEAGFTARMIQGLELDCRDDEASNSLHDFTLACKWKTCRNHIIIDVMNVWRGVLALQNPCMVLQSDYFEADEA